MKLIYGLIPILLAPIPVSAMINSEIQSLSIDNLKSSKVFDMDFNSNKNINIINNIEYSTIGTTAKYASSIKGNGFETNGSKITIPFKDLGIESTDTVLTVTFLMKHRGGSNIMPIGISGTGQYHGANDLWLYNGNLGFNTGNSDQFGTTNPFKENKFYSITAEFHQNDIIENKLYIDGILQPLSHKNNPISLSTSWDSNALFSIGGFPANDVYNCTDDTIIDEVRIYKKALTQSEVNEVANEHKIPILRGEVVSNKYPKISWATEILPENILWKLGYEQDEQSGINFVYNSANGLGTGGQEFRTDNVFSGKYSIYTPNTNPDKGNTVAWPYTSVTYKNHIWYTGKSIGLENNTPISTSFRLKGEGSLTTQIYSDWEYINTFKYYNATYAEDYPVGTKQIKVSNYSLFKLGTHITVDPDSFNHERNNSVKTLDDEAQIITLAYPLNYAVKKGETIKYRANSTMFSFPSLSTKGSGNWELYNLNGTVTNPSDYSWEEHPVRLRQQWSSNNYAYFDDLTVGHATKVRLYRDNLKVYEGYGSELSDTTAIDKATPNAVSLSSINNTMTMITPNTSTRKLTINFENVIDNGTLYNYNVSAISNDGVETPKSETIQQTVTSEIKGYSYLIDKNANTIPIDTVNLTTNSIEANITDTGFYYLHIKAIDNQGNVSGVTHYKIDIPTLTSQDKPAENRIRLDWTMGNTSNKTFKVYQQKEGSNTFQSISSTDFDKNKQIKVLNIHPNAGSSITYTTWDGETITDVKSSSLKQWMEEPNAENPKGYGKGVIEVTPITIQDFNSNPDSYLKDTNGEYKYDVVMFGTWDSNNSKDLTQISLNAVKAFADTGKGLLVGHDTLRQGTFPYFNQLRTYVKIETPGDENIASLYQNVKYSVVSKDVSKKKSGLLTNYPWVIDKSQLTVPTTHTSRQWAYGDVWFDFINIDSTIYAGYEGVIYNGLDGRGTNNFYLTTWNNASMIQTGHSSGQATPDEQKILANTLFYLNQLSTDNYLDDNSGQDVSAPNKPTLNNQTINNNGTMTFNFNSVIDNGSEYSYYVESNDKSSDSVNLSNVVTEVITSGLKGYSFVTDSTATTIPDDVIDTISSNTITANINSNTMYLHLKAIDNIGNSSETLHIKVSDTDNPTMNITGNPTTWTNQNVTLNVTGLDIGLGVKHIVLPNGTIVTGSSANYSVTANGNYTFKIVDKMGNITTQTIVVDKIDKSINNIMNINQTMSMLNTTTSSRRMTFTFNPVIETNQSGLKGYSYVIDKSPNTIPNNTVITNSTTITKDISDTGVYYIHLKAIDNAGNITNIVHHKVDVPNLTANSNTIEDKIRLDWTMEDENNKTFKVYQKKPGSNVFQSISMTNFDNNEKVRVLNIFPTYNAPEVEDNRVDLAGEKLHKSALLEEWIRAYGMDKIVVDSLNKESYDKNPEEWLKNSDGTYKYDVIVVGFWNINYAEEQISNNGIEAIREFINSGGGVMTGHHHMALWHLDKGMNRLKDEFGVKFVVETGWASTEVEPVEIDYYLPETSRDRWCSRYWHNSSTVKAEKKGLLLNYPHNISDADRLFNIPTTHNTNDFVTGDVWLSFQNSTAHNFGGTAKNITQLPDGTVGAKNSYLSTYNNTALIQTGHSSLTNGTLFATEDEKKILANTLFYLNQQSTDNFLDDNSGQDVTAPNKPEFYEHKFTEDGFIELKFNAVIDNGSEYSYYVESQTRDNDSLTLSNVFTETITSGMSGYSFIVDSNSNTIPDDNIDQATNETIKIKTNNSGELYVHIKAIDNVGNSSETYHYRITDNIKPVINVTLVPNTWTKGSVTINATAMDSGSGIKYLVLPNGNIVKGINSNYTVNQNGLYYFKAIDYMGNVATAEVRISNIDKKIPTVTITNNQNWTNQDVQVTIIGSDE